MAARTCQICPTNHPRKIIASGVTWHRVFISASAVSSKMFSAACLNLPVGMRMHNIGRSVKSYTSLQASANLCRARGKMASARLLNSGTTMRCPSPAPTLDGSKLLRGFATGTRFLGQSQAATVTDDASFSNATTADATATAAAAGAAGRTIREDWMVCCNKTSHFGQLIGPCDHY